MTTTTTTKTALPALPDNLLVDEIMETILDPTCKYIANPETPEEWVEWAKGFIQYDKEFDLSEAEWNSYDGWDIFSKELDQIARKFKHYIKEIKRVPGSEGILDGVFGWEFGKAIDEARKLDPRLQEFDVEDLAEYWKDYYQLEADSFYGFKRVTSD